ncbi:SDR family NAD(P)-dependent oxidoreductase [Labedaea rhizosphaerae]|uniref:Short-subunit dehydrogenase n=1 Tax=Labedaea rhizosphaerae TaxID=598644 RepID=A0A4R6SJ15_LABRH|nr:SDR family NAD(P)-dependent oxidoreductase [Labedaea rhizosphaerae]TDQ00909.1 short-subunit dehydrogenase [Labedaea rhizosphaerae]
MTTATNPRVLITGASSGIGRELAEIFARNGYRVLLAADDDLLDKAVDELRATGAAVDGHRLDLAVPDEVDRLAAWTQDVAGGVDALVLNAGTGVNGAFAGSATGLHEQLKVVDVNVRSVVHLAKLLVPGMVGAGHGRVLITSSIAGVSPGPYNSVYNASKAFLSSFAQALRDELRGSGVSVTTLMPGPTDTLFFDRAKMHDTKLGQSSKDDAKTVAEQGFSAMMKGTDHVVAGSFFNKVQSVAGHLLPDPLLAAVHRRMTMPGSGRR